MKKASDFIDILVNSYQMDKHSSSINLFSAWRTIAGEDVASHATLKDIEDGVLIIEVDHPGWLQLVLLQKKKIIASVHRDFPELHIKDIRVTHERRRT